MNGRPLNFKEFMGMTNQSATPAEFEIKNSIVGSKMYFPPKRERIGEEELVPFIIAGGTSFRSSPNTDMQQRVPPI